MPKSRLLWVLIIPVLLMGLIPVQAQEPVTILIALPAFYEDTLKEPLDGFMAANPDIVVEIVPNELPEFTAGDDIEGYFDSMEEFARSADVLVGQGQFNVLTTRAGYFLNLAPLVSADSSLNVDEFFTSMWEAFQWDGSIWALPLSGDVIGMAYDPAAFDEVGLTYPTERWTVDDLILAAEQLAVFGEGDTVEQPPITNFSNAGYVAVAALDAPLYDPFQLEGLPDFSNPALEPALERWAQLQEDGYVAQPEGLEFSDIIFAPSILTAVTDFAGVDAEYEFMTLPGGAVAVQPLGAGISAGTQHPEEAYRLIKYMTEEADIFTALVGQPLPARRHLFGAEGDTPFFALELPPDLQERVLDFADAGVPFSHTLFYEYITAAATDMATSDNDARTALDTVEEQALNDLQAAIERRESTVIVDASEGTVVGSGDVNLVFGIVGFGPIPNRDEWNLAIEDFVTNDPQVATVELERLSFISGDITLSDFAEKVDCFYQGNRLNTSQDLSLLLPINPLLTTDPNLSIDDFVGDTLTQLSQNDVIYGMPLHLQPEVFYFNVDLFNASGAFLPYQGWNVSDFEQALRTLKFDSGDLPPFEARSQGGLYALSLVAAYGGLPLDFRTSPPTVDFTSDINVTAIQQVLDLAKDGIYSVRPIGSRPGSGLWQRQSGKSSAVC